MKSTVPKCFTFCCYLKPRSSLLCSHRRVESSIWPPLYLQRCVLSRWTAHGWCRGNGRCQTSLEFLHWSWTGDSGKTKIFSNLKCLKRKLNSLDTLHFTKAPFFFFVQVASFPFLKSMSLLVVVPMSLQTNISSLAAKIDVSNLYNRLPKERAVQVKVPKFKLEYGQELKDVFIKLGKTCFLWT